MMHLFIYNIFTIYFFLLSFILCFFFFFFSSRRRHTRFDCDWSSDVCSSDLRAYVAAIQLIKKDQNFSEKTFAKWLREKDPYLIKKTVESYAKLFKPTPRSEERRVGKECRSRWSPYH